MTDPAGDRLYQLLPAIYRIRDAGQGQPLRALLALMAEELHAVEDDISQLYNDAFIETCAEWVVPYIGDLLAVRTLPGAGLISQRAYVANTIAYRRRKGTIAALEQLARDVTGWPARAVEFFERLMATQHLNHVRPHCRIAPDLRRAADLELLDGPFETAMHSADVRRIAVGRGRHNIPYIGVFLWRLHSYAVTNSDARPVADPDDGRYTFSPTGDDAPLFNPFQSERDITTLAGEADVPGILRRRPLYAELEQRWQATIDGISAQQQLEQSVFFGLQPALAVMIDGVPVASAEVFICDLSDWRRPPSAKTYTPTAGGAPVDLPVAIAVDPQLGRLALPVSASLPARVQVSYCYGFSGDVGGGPYDRSETQEWWHQRHGSVTWQIGVTQDAATIAAAPDPTQLRQSLTAAVTAWNQHLADPANAGAHGLIVIMDSRTYREALTGANAIVVPPGSRLAIVAGEWPLEVDPDHPGELRRRTGVVTLANQRPHLRGAIEVRALSPAADEDPGELTLDGLLIEGRMTITPGDLGVLRLAHCTLTPAAGGLRVEKGATAGQQHQRLRIGLLRCISGPIALPEEVPELRIGESIIDGQSDADGAAIKAPGAALDVQASTVFGSIEARSLSADNSIFTGKITVERRQIGCMRFCYTPPESRTGRRYRCQPDLALEQRASALGLDPVATLPASERESILARIRPTFTSQRYGHPAYAQLSLICPPEIGAGGEDGAEMGVWYMLKNPQREASLRAVFAEYLRFGMEAGIVYVT